MGRLTKPIYKIPDDYELPKIKFGMPMTRQYYSFDERVMLMLAEWFPERSPHLLRSTALDLYLLSGYQPFTDPEPSEFVENQTVKLLMEYRMIGDGN